MKQPERTGAGAMQHKGCHGVKSLCLEQTLTVIRIALCRLAQYVAPQTVKLHNHCKIEKLVCLSWTKVRQQARPGETQPAGQHFKSMRLPQVPTLPMQTYKTRGPCLQNTCACAGPRGLRQSGQSTRASLRQDLKASMSRARASSRRSSQFDADAMRESLSLFLQLEGAANEADGPEEVQDSTADGFRHMCSFVLSTLLAHVARE